MRDWFECYKIQRNIRKNNKKQQEYEEKLKSHAEDDAQPEEPEKKALCNYFGNNGQPMSKETALKAIAVCHEQWREMHKKLRGNKQWEYVKDGNELVYCE